MEIQPNQLDISLTTGELELILGADDLRHSDNDTVNLAGVEGSTWMTTVMPVGLSLLVNLKFYICLQPFNFSGPSLSLKKL